MLMLLPLVMALSLLTLLPLVTLLSLLKVEAGVLRSARRLCAACAIAASWLLFSGLSS